MAGRAGTGSGRRWARGFRALTLASVFTLPAAAQQAPTGGNVVVGGAGISQQAGNTLINQTTDRALIDWRSFDIGRDQSVIVTQPGAGSLLVNRVTGGGAGTRIDGSLTANGQVVVIDKAGIIIGRGARIDAGSFLATTSDIDNADFAAGRLLFGKAGVAGAAIVNEGTIRVAEGGYAALAAAIVENRGLVEARLGRVVLAGVEHFTLDLAGDGLLRFELPAEMAGRVVNDGTLAGTRVLMTAQAARDGMAATINAGGLVEAVSAQEVDGRIIIGGEGTQTLVTGDLTARNGAIDILGDRVELAGAGIDAGGQGGGGTVRIGGDYQGGGDLHRARSTRIDAGSRITADAVGTGDGGRIIVWSDGRTDYAGSISARGADGGDGGFAEVSGKGSLRFAGTADLTAGAGGRAGTLLLDPTNIVIGGTADINGDGTQGDDLSGAGDLDSVTDYAGADSYITAAAVAALLNTGTSVTLSASQDITLSSSIDKTGGAGASFTLRAGRDIVIGAGAGVSSSAGALNIDFQAGYGTGAGRIVSAATGTESFASNGGTISFTGYGRAGAITGIDLSGVSLNSGAGAITLTGTAATGAGGSGIRIADGTVLQSTYGAITLTGTGGQGAGLNFEGSGHNHIQTQTGTVTLTGMSGAGSSNDHTIGLRAINLSVTATGAAAISLTGTSVSGAGAAYGIELHGDGGTRAITSNGGAISVTGAGGGSSGGLNYGVMIYDGYAVRAGSGAVTVTAKGGAGSIGIANERDGSAMLGGAGQSGQVEIVSDGTDLGGISIQTTGTAVLRPGTAGTAIVIGGSDNAAGPLGLTQTELNRVTAGTLVIGSATSGTISASASFSPANVGTLELSAQTLNIGADIASLAVAVLNAGRSITLTSGGGMVVSSGIAKTGTTSSFPLLTLRAKGDLTFGSGIGVTASGGAVHMAFEAGHHGTAGQFSATGTGSFVSGGGYIDMAGRTSVTLDGSTLNAGAGSITLSGDDIALTGSSVTSTGRVWLRQYSDSRAMDIGATGAGAGKMAVSIAELAQISAGVVRLGSMSNTAGITITSTLNHAGDMIELASAGNVTQTAAIGVANLALLGAGGTYTLTHGSNAVTTLAGNTGSIDFRSSPSLTVGTVRDTTGITFTGSVSLYALDALVTLGQAATYAGTGTGTLTLSSHIDVAVAANIGVSGSGRLNIVLAADGNQAGSPGQVTVTGATLSSNGGNITIGSGATPATRAAVGGAATGIGVNITGSILNAGTGGHILVNGDGAPSGVNTAAGIGINVSGSSLIAAGTGTITLNGKGGAGNALTAGVAIGDGSTIRTATGALAINGEQATAGTARYGVLLRNDPTAASAIYSTGGGGVSLTATGTAGRIGAFVSGSDYSRAHIGWDGVSAYGGAVTLTADDMALTNGSGGTAISINGTGTLTLRTNGTGASIAVGDGVAGGADLELEQGDLDAIRAGVGTKAGFSGVTIGRSDGTGTVTVAGAGLKNNLTILSGTGGITIAGPLATGSGVDAGAIALDTAGLLTISGAITTQNQSISLITDKLDLTGSVDAGTGTATLSVKTAGRGIDLGSTGPSTTTLDISAAEMNRVTAGTIRIGDAAAGAIVISAAMAPTGSGTLHLRSGSGISQTAALTVTNLAVTAAGTVVLDNAGNDVTNLAASLTSGGLTFRDADGFSVSIIDSVTGVGSGSGSVTFISAGTVTQTAAISAAGLALTGAGGTYRLAHAANAVGVLAASTGLVDVGLSGAVAIGTVGSLTGVTATGTVKISTGGALTIANGALVSAVGTGDALVLAANGNFINNAGAGALAVSGGGRFLVFSAAPSTSSTGGVSALPLYNRSFDFTGRDFAAISNSGNRFVYTYAPVLTVTPDNKTHTYDGTVPGLTYTVTGLVSGDLLSQAVSGTASITGAGSGAGSYTLTAGAGTLLSDLGYGFSYGTGTLTIDRRALTYAVANVNAVYGTVAGNGSATLTGVVDGDVVTGTVTTHGSDGAVTPVARTPVGTLTQKVTGLGGADAANYTIALSGNSDGILTIAPKPLTYTVAAAGSVYGTLATLGGVTLTGIVDGDSVTAGATLSGAVLAERLAAGTYIQEAGTLAGADAANYTFAATGNSTGILTIARKSLTYAVADTGSTYGTLATLGDVTLTGVLSGDVVAGTAELSGATLGERLNAGSYTVAVGGLTGTAAGNYEIAATGNSTGTLTVARKTITGTVTAVTGTYGQGMAAGAGILTGVLTGDEVLGTVQVSGGGGAVTPGPTLGAGSYIQDIIAITGADAANYTLGTTVAGTLTVDPAQLTVTADARTRIYGTVDPDLTYSVTGLVNGDTLTGGLVRVEGGNVGTYAIIQGSLAASGNYVLNFTGAELTITPAALTITAPSVTKVYGDNDPNLAYSVSGLVAGDSLSGALAREAGEDAGTYAITQGSLTAGGNYTLTLDAGVLTITPAPLLVTALPAAMVYGRAVPELSYRVDGLRRGDTGGAVLSGALAWAGGRDAGTYAVTQGDLTANANYTLSFTGSTLTISPAALTVTADRLTKTYGTGDPTLTYSVSGLVAGDSLSGALSREVGENVGTYAVGQGDLTGGPNYTLSFTGGALTIDPATLTVTASALTRVYGDADPDLAYSVSGLVAGDSLSGALSREVGENVGTYAVTQGSLTAGGNYIVTFIDGSLEITPAPLTINVAAATKIYGDADPALTYQVSGLKNGDALSGALSREVGENAGSYAITQGSLTAGGNYELTFTSGTLTITPAALTISALSAGKVYGDADPALTYQVSGLKNGDSLSGALSREVGENAGSYAITQGSLTAGGNYELTFTGGRLTIDPALLTITAQAASRLYGAPDPALAFTASGFRRQDSAASVLSGTLSRAAGGDAGRYAITQGSLVANANYRILFQGAELTIAPVALTVLVDNATRQAGTANPVFTARYEGLVNGDTAASLTGLTITSTADAGATAGAYGIRAGGITNGNYLVTYVDGTLTVTGGGVLPPALAEKVPVTTITQPPQTPGLTGMAVAAPVVPAAPAAPPAATASSSPASGAPGLDAGAAALAAASQSVQSASGSAADDDSAPEEMIPGLLSQQRRLPGETPDGTPGLEQQFPNLGRVW
ncbi:MBG domain-containing protein [Niveispirillum fermenti]|uniref:MBG domain-containing protein n=1 Tax=Niveispirillum fermenti TaxID=1233113 RepID=UPI003A85207D